VATKLTLRMDDAIIDRAKVYARRNKTSLSKIVSQYLRSLLTSKKEGRPIAPLVKEISGILSPSRSSRSVKTDYHQYLEKKHR
jgi:hypothetical protein